MGSSKNRPLLIKIGIFLMGIAIVLSVFAMNSIMVSKMREDAHNLVEQIAKAYAEAINQSDNLYFPMLMEHLLPTINFPLIITTADSVALEVYAIKNLEIDRQSHTFEAEVKDMIRRMDQSFEPLPVKWESETIGYIHFGDSNLLSQLRWLPYLELGFSFIFVLLSFFGFQFIRNSERQSIWIGMARETAHQLGTPISSLMGWIEMLREDTVQKDAVLGNMSQDLERLREISDRFQKIGSQPTLRATDVTGIANEVAEYLQHRIPKSSAIRVQCSGAARQVMGDRTLLFWSLENLAKNALDAMDSKKGNIHITLRDEGEQVIIEVSDTGKGITRTDRDNIFRPGFSTKKKGWGLGLSLTRRIVEEIHSGRIRLLRSKPGETVFSISLHAEG